MHHRPTLQINNSKKRDKQLNILKISLQDSNNEGYQFNDLGFSTVSPDNVPLIKQMNRSSPEFTNNLFFGNDMCNMISSPFKDADMKSESNYRPLSPSGAQDIDTFNKNMKAFTSYKNLISHEGSAMSIFGSPPVNQAKQSTNFNYEDSVFNLAEKGAKRVVNHIHEALNGSCDFSLNLYHIPNGGHKIEDSNSKQEISLKESKERISLSLQTELKHLNKLFLLLVKIFTRKDMTEEDMNIGQGELKILNYVLQRKYLRRLTTKDIESSVTVQLEKLCGIVGLKSHKRPEECNKFVFTRVLKFLKKGFKKNFNIKQNLDEQFYSYYFGEIAQKNQEPIEVYYYPLTKKDNKKETLNANYFGRIFQSKSFLNDLVKYINEHLNEEYKTEIIQKIESLLFKWDGYFLKGDQQIEKHLEEIKTYLMMNKRCKLPWTLDEVKEAVLRVYSLIDTHGNSNLSITLDRSALFQQ